MLNLRDRFQSKQTLLWVGHRGDGTNYTSSLTENTIPSFDAALNKGADMLEFDIQLTKDEQLALWHNDTITPKDSSVLQHPTPLSKLTLSECQELPLRHNAKIPSLAEVFINYHSKCYFYCELKFIPTHTVAHHKTLVEKTVALIQHYSLEDHCMLVSFEPMLLNMIPKTFTGLIGLNRSLDYKPHVALHATIDCYCPNMSSYDELIPAHWKGSVLPYNVNTEEDILYCKQTHCVGVTTDDLSLKTHD